MERTSLEPLNNGWRETHRRDRFAIGMQEILRLSATVKAKAKTARKSKTRATSKGKAGPRPHDARLGGR